MKIYVTGEQEPYRAEVVLDGSERRDEAERIVGGEVIPEIMGHFAVQLTDGEIETVGGQSRVTIIDRRTV